MYSPSLIIPKEKMEEYEKKDSTWQLMHWPKALKPFDACATVFPASKGLTGFQHRVFVTPPSRGIDFRLINGYMLGGGVYEPYKDPKVIEERAQAFHAKDDL